MEYDRELGRERQEIEQETGTEAEEETQSERQLK